MRKYFRGWKTLRKEELFYLEVNLEKTRFH